MPNAAPGPGLQLRFMNLRPTLASSLPDVAPVEADPDPLTLENSVELREATLRLRDRRLAIVIDPNESVSSEKSAVRGRVGVPGAEA